MKYGLAIIGLSLLVGLSVLAGFACTTGRMGSSPHDKPRVSLHVTPVMAFSGAPLDVTIRVSASSQNRGIILAVDGGGDYLSISSYELMPNTANTRTFHLPRVRSAHDDGSVVVTATLTGERGPITTVDKLIYRRQE